MRREVRRRGGIEVAEGAQWSKVERYRGAPPAGGVARAGGGTGAQWS
jgi:hypothetical protein